MVTDPYVHAVEALTAAVKCGSRREARRAFRLHATSLECISLGVPSLVDTTQALNDIGREPEMVLNSVKFHGEGFLFLRSLRSLVSTLVKRRKWGTSLNKHLASVLIQRCARTSAGADAYFAVQQLLGIDNGNTAMNLIVVPTQEALKAPIDVKCLLRDNAMYCQITIRNAFCLSQPFSGMGQAPFRTACSISSNTSIVFRNREGVDKWMDVCTVVTDTLTLRATDNPWAIAWVRTLKIAPLCETRGA